MNNIKENKSNKIKYLLAVIVFIVFVVITNNGLKLSEGDTIELFPAIFMEAFVSIHMSIFVLWPLSCLTDTPKDEFKKLFIGRVIILLIGDIFISPMATAVIDFISVFIGAFIVVPLSGAWSKIGTSSSHTSNINIKMNNNYNDSNFKYNLSTSLVNYLFALSEQDKDELKKVTSNKMYDDTLKMVETSETYNKRNIIDDIDITEFNILFRYTNNNEEFVQAIIILSAIDCTEYNSTASLNRKKRDYEYKVVFKRNNDVTPVKIDLERCPYCSASILDKSKEECEYCGSLLSEKKNEWLIEKLEKTLIK